MNVLINGFSGAVGNRIIENTFRDVNLGYCLSILRKDEALPALSNCEEQDQFDPQSMKDVDWNTILPLDEIVIEGMRRCETTFLHMKGRREWRGASLPYDERKRIYLQNLRYWNHVLETQSINVFLSATLPHRSRTLLIYYLCKLKGIPTIFPYHSGPVDGDFHIVEDLESYAAFGAVHKQVQEKYLHSDEPIPLADRYERYFQKQISPKDPSPAWSLDPDRRTWGRWFGMIFSMLTKDVRKFLRQIPSSIYNRLSLTYWIRGGIEMYRVRRARKMFRLYDRNAVSPDLTQEYVYLPLHQQPEASACPMCGAYMDQILTVKMLDALLPHGVHIYVKEHPNQQNTFPDGRGRSFEFYQDLLRSDRVTLISRSSNTFDLIKHCKAVATGTGTAGFESLFRETPVLMFGHWTHQHAGGVFPVHTTEDCKKGINAIFTENAKPSLRDARIYLKALEEISITAYIDERWEEHSEHDEHASALLFSNALRKKLHEKFPEISPNTPVAEHSQEMPVLSSS